MRERLKVEIDNYLNNCAGVMNLSLKTVKSYNTDLEQFSEFCNNKNIQLVRDVDKSLILDYTQRCQEMFKTNTTKRKIASVKAFFRYLELDNEQYNSPFRRIKHRFAPSNTLPVTLSYHQMQEYLTQMYHKWEKDKADKFILRDIAVVEVLFLTGIRVSEMSNLLYRNVFLQEGSLLINGKGNRQRYVYLSNQKVLTILKKYQNQFKEQIDDTGFFFINNRDSKLSDQSIRHIVKRHNPFSDTIHVTPHVFRHSCASLLLNSGLNLRMIQNVLGHASIKTTQIYTHISDTELTQALISKHPRNTMR